MNYFKKFCLSVRDFWCHVFRHHKILIWVLLLTFVLGILSVFILDEATKTELVKIVVQKLQEEMPTDGRGWSLFVYIWKNNVQVVMLTWGLACLLFIPYLIEYFNGLIIGVVVGFSLSSTTWGQVALMILPHGVFELLFFFAGALLSLLFWLKIYFPKKFFADDSRLKIIKLIIMNFAIIIIGLGFSAAIEAWLTPFLAGVN